MKKALKYLAIGIGAVVVLSIVAPFVVPASAYRNFILKQVNEQINGKLELSDIRIKLLPLPGLALKDVKLSNTTGKFSGQLLVSAGEVSANVELMPLFSKNAIVTLKLVGPSVFYRSDKEGRTNLNDLMKDKAKPQVLGSKTKFELIRSAYAGTEAVPSAWKVMVKGLEIKDGLAVISKDGAPNQEVGHLDLKLLGFSPTAKKALGDIYVAAALLGSEKQNFKLDGKLGLNMVDKTATAKEMDLTVGSAVFKLDANANYNEPMMADLSLSLTKATVGDLLAFSPKIAAELPKDISRAVLSKTPIAIDINAGYKKSGIAVTKLLFSLGGTRLSATGNISMDPGMPADISVKMSPIKIAELQNIIPALAPIGGIVDPKVDLRVDGPIANAKKISVSGHVETSKVKYQDYEISGLKTDIRYANERINLTSLTGNLYKGTLNGSGWLGMAGEPAYGADVAIDNVDMAEVPATKELLKGRGTLKVNATGMGADAAAIKKNLKADGSIRLADGDIPSLKLGEKIFGNPVWNILAKANVGLNQAGLNELRSLDASCQEFTATFKVENGVIDTPDVKWQHKKYRANLSGSVSMDENLNYKGQFSLLKPSTDILITNQVARDILVNNSGELAIPFNVSGNVSSPSVTPDEKHLAALFAKAATAAVAGKAKEVIQSVVPTGVKDTGKKLIQGIFGR